MDISTVRPKVATLTFRLLGRSVHPELFQISKTHRIDRENFRAQLHITADGHAISWSSGKQTLTEVASSYHQPLPESRRIVETPLQYSGSDTIECSSGAMYSYEYELERVPPEMFWMMQKQLGESAKNHELIHIFGSSGRIDIGGLSFIHVDTRLKSMHIQAIHTFPDDLTLVKTQSTFRLQ